MKALIFQNKVVQLESADFPVAAPLIWVDAADGVEVGYSYENGQFAAPPPLPAPSAEQVRHQKQAAYQAESDPIFFKWQRGEATEQQWLDKVAEIDQRFS